MNHDSGSQKINNVVILGGGRLALAISKLLVDMQIKTSVVTCERQAIETFNNKSFENQVKEIVDAFEVTGKINESNIVKNVVDVSTIFLSVGAAWIFLKKDIQESFNNRIFNLHGTRLPENRGGGGFSWQIMMGIRHGFAVIHKVDGGIDTGKIVASKEFLYPPSLRTPLSMENLYISKNLELLKEFISNFNNNEQALAGLQQSEYFSTYWPRLDTDTHGFINWDLNPIELERFICAFDEPYKGASTFIDGKRVHLKSVMLCTQNSGFHNFQNGLVFRKRSDWLCVSVGGKTLIIEEITDENGQSYMNDVEIGDRLFTPISYLEQTKIRVRYTPKGIQKA